jgi:hypothetical protein
MKYGNVSALRSSAPSSSATTDRDRRARGGDAGAAAEDVVGIVISVTSVVWCGVVLIGRKIELLWAYW